MNISPYIKIVTSKNHFTKEIYENIEKDNAYVICAKRSTVIDYVTNIRSQLYSTSIFPFEVGENIYITDFFSFNNQENCNCPGVFCNEDRFYTSEEYTIISCKKDRLYSKYFKNTYDIFEFEINYMLHNGEPLKLRKICDNSKEQFEKDVKIKAKEVTKIPNNNGYWKVYFSEKNKWNSPFTSSLALTAYKSQGSSYDYVFVDATDIEQCRRTTFLKSKEIYTSITRAKTYLCIYIDLEKISKELPNNITKCVRCRAWRNFNQFKLNKKGVFIKTCVICSEKAKKKRNALKSEEL